MSILVIQNIAIDPIGVYGEYLRAQGRRLQIWLPQEQPSPPPGDYSGLIVLGGSMNACEDDAFPHLRQVVDLIHQFSDAGKPILGICLGAQLIARAFGGRVYQNPEPELGFTPVYPAATSLAEPFLQSCPPNLHMMQWHFDTFDLPAGAELLMSSDRCRHQFYRIGNNIYGVQFHPEVSPEIVRGWLVANSAWVEEHYPSFPEELEQQLQAHWQQSTEFARQIIQSWCAQLPAAALKAI